MITPVILCGGSGTRLWPLSRKGYPKQFTALAGPGQSLFQAAAARLQGPGFAPPLVVTGPAFRFIATDQLDEIGLQDATVLIEPAARNTAADARAAFDMCYPSPHPLPDASVSSSAGRGCSVAGSMSEGRGCYFEGPGARRLSPNPQSKRDDEFHLIPRYVNAAGGAGGAAGVPRV